MGAHRSEPGRLAATAVGIDHRQAFLGRLAPGFTPGPQRQDHRVERVAFFREVIFVAFWPLTISAALYEPVGLHALQARRDHLRRTAGLRLDVIKAMAAHEQLPQHQHRPAVANDDFGPGDRTQGFRNGCFHRHAALPLS
ncbi:hypothetical protein D3C84_792700 [compost metagenome]